MKYFAAVFLWLITFAAQAAPTINTSGLKVVGNTLRNAQNQTVFIHGVNRIDTTLCQGGQGHTLPYASDYTRTTAYAVKLRDQWNVNAVRVMINEWCWRNDTVIGGVGYRAAMRQLVSSVTSSNMIAIVTLAIVDHQGRLPTLEFNDPRNAMPNVDYSIGVWQEMANIWKANSRVIFDLFNEPIPYYTTSDEGALVNGAYDDAKAWPCLRNGRAACAVSSFPSVQAPVMGNKAVGMQELLNTVRATGATNVVLIPGTVFSALHTRWVEFKPLDSLQPEQIAASAHIADFGLGYCEGQFPTLKACLDQRWSTNGTGRHIASQVPVVWGEIVAGDCAGAASFFPFMYAYVENLKQGYLQHAAVSTNGTNGDIDEQGVDPCSRSALFTTYGTESGNKGPILASPFGRPFLDHVKSLSWTWDPAPGGNPSPNLVRNGNFSSGQLEPWEFVSVRPAVARASVSSQVDHQGNRSPAVVIDVQSAFNKTRHGQLLQRGIPLVKGRSYTIRFWARASRSRAIDIVLAKGEFQTNGVCAATKSLTTTIREVVVKCRPTFSTSNGVLMLRTGKTTGQVYIDDVRLR